jgi:hypothetical protein
MTEKAVLNLLEDMLLHEFAGRGALISEKRHPGFF